MNHTMMKTMNHIMMKTVKKMTATEKATGNMTIGKNIITVAMLVAVLLTVGCGTAKELNVDDVSAKLLSEITYTDELSEIDLETAQMLFYLDDIQITKAKIYESGGATAEEIAVFECASTEDADRVMTAMQTRVEEQKESFRDYVPEELLKLDAAVLVKSRNVVVLSVSGDAETARKIISGQ